MVGPSGARRIPERDWKVYRDLHRTLVERYCRRVLDEVESLIGAESQSAHDRYGRLYGLIRDRDKEIARVFDGMRRSAALFQIEACRELGLLTDEEMSRFSDETQELIARWLEFRRSE